VPSRTTPGKADREDEGRAAASTVLQQLDRPNRFATLEVWDTETHYNAWQDDAKTTKFLTKVKPLMGSPLDHRLNILCGETYVDGMGCTPP
jgi:quinol monooxygenase YgiN